MSIIIRLQNLPWAANSVDIRRYFTGLSIPEGGVHIVGGEKGDAFIAFGSDEDARQAMERDGGKIKDMKVKLFLSSRTEMARVIEQARNQNLSLQTPSAVKAAANDSDRRRTIERNPSPKRREREKSPPRDRERRRSAKRDRSRTRSRSPFRRTKDRERDSDRRNDRQRREDRGDSHDRYKNAAEFVSREQTQEQRQYGLTEKDLLHTSQNVEMGKTFDPRIGSTPQTYDSRQMEGTTANFNVRHENISRNSPYVGSQNPASEASPYLFPAAMNTMAMKGQTKNLNEPLQPPAFAGSVFHSSFDKRATSMGNYESKRPSPTPATSAPNVGSSVPYTKDYGVSDPYSNNIAHGYGEYGSVHTAERGTLPAIPNDCRVFHSNPPIYGAEPHARYDLIPEANQAGRSSNAPAPKEMAGHEGGIYGKMLPTNMPVISASSNIPANKPTRRSRFEPAPHEDNQFHAENISKSEARPQSSFVRQTDPRTNFPKNMEGNFVRERGRGNEAPWAARMSGSHQNSWTEECQDGSMLHSTLPNEYHDTMAMEMGEESLPQGTPHHMNSNAGPSSHLQNHNLQRHGPADRTAVRERFGFHPKHPRDSNFSGKTSSSAHDQQFSEVRPSTALNRKDPQHYGLTVEVRGLHFDASECDLIELFRGIFVPHENIKLQRNHHVKLGGCGYVKFLNIKDFKDGLTRTRSKVCGSIVQILPCSLTTFNSAQNESVCSHGKEQQMAPLLRTDHESRKIIESGISARKNIEPNYSRSSEQTKKPPGIPQTESTEKTAFQTLPEAMPQRNMSEKVSNSKSQESMSQMKPPESASQRKRLEGEQQRKALDAMSQKSVAPDHMPQRKPSESPPQRKPQNSTSQRKLLEPAAQRKMSDPTLEKSVMGKKSEPTVQRKPAESRLNQNPTEISPKRKPPERTSSEPLLQRKPFEPVSHRNALGQGQPRKPLVPTPPRKGLEPGSQRKATEQEPQPPYFHRSNLEPCEEDLCVELRGLPYTCQDDEIIHFFDALGILDIFIELGPDGRATGVGFVEFATPADFHAALDLNGKRIGHRYIDILVASKEIMAVARGERPKPPLIPQGPPREMSHSVRAQVQPPPPPLVFCVALNGLPNHVTNRDISDFFADVSLVPRAIHIMLSPNKTPTGEAFAEFNTPMEFQTALERNGYMLAGERAIISPISYEEMVEILGSPPALPMPPPPQTLLRNPGANDHPPARRALMPLPGEDEMQMGDCRPHDTLHKGLNRPDFPAAESFPFDHSEPHIPHLPRVRAEGISGGNRPRPPFRQRGPLFHPRHPAPTRFPGPTRNNNEPKGFGVPGCVLGIDNLHYRAGLDDLLDFFHGYDIDKNSIIRKYNESGQATGEARVAFSCHEDAVHAVRELNMKTIMGRPVSLSIV